MRWTGTALIVKCGFILLLLFYILLSEVFFFFSFLVTPIIPASQKSIISNSNWAWIQQANWTTYFMEDTLQMPSLSWTFMYKVKILKFYVCKCLIFNISLSWVASTQEVWQSHKFHQEEQAASVIWKVSFIWGALV